MRKIKKINEMKGNFFIKGITNKYDLQLSYSKFTISLSPIIKNINELAKVREKIGDLEEVATLEISNGANKNELISLAITIKKLLSLGLGEHIIFDRSVFEENESSEEMRKAMVKNSNSGWQIIPNHELCAFLKSTIPVWHQMDKEEQNRYYLIIDYLNQSYKGFIEDRILRVAQAWESLTDFLKVEGVIPDVLLELRNDLIAVYRKWKKKEGSQEFDLNGELGNKITSAINQEKLLSKLFNLAEQESLDLKAINLDFRVLKNLRDKVAHTGKIDIPGREAIKILEPAVKGLQIILLKRLKYNGKIIHHKDGGSTIEEITNFEKNNTEHNKA